MGCSGDDAVHIGQALLQQWRAIGSSRGLSSDADIANFLVTLYRDKRSVEQCCPFCRTPLVLCCPRCAPPPFPPHLTPTPPQALSFSPPSAPPLSLTPLPSVGDDSDACGGVVVTACSHNISHDNNCCSINNESDDRTICSDVCNKNSNNRNINVFNNTHDSSNSRNNNKNNTNNRNNNGYSGCGENEEEDDKNGARGTTPVESEERQNPAKLSLADRPFAHPPLPEISIHEDNDNDVENNDDIDDDDNNVDDDTTTDLSFLHPSPAHNINTNVDNNNVDSDMTTEFIDFRSVNCGGSDREWSAGHCQWQKEEKKNTHVVLVSMGKQERNRVEAIPLDTTGDSVDIVKEHGNHEQTIEAIPFDRTGDSVNIVQEHSNCEQTIEAIPLDTTGDSVDVVKDHSNCEKTVRAEGNQTTSQNSHTTTLDEHNDVCLAASKEEINWLNTTAGKQNNESQALKEQSTGTEDSRGEAGSADNRDVYDRDTDIDSAQEEIHDGDPDPERDIAPLKTPCHDTASLNIPCHNTVSLNIPCHNTASLNTPCHDGCDKNEGDAATFSKTSSRQFTEEHKHRNRNYPRTTTVSYQSGKEHHYRHNQSLLLLSEHESASPNSTRNQNPQSLFFSGIETRGLLNSVALAAAPPWLCAAPTAPHHPSPHTSQHPHCGPGFPQTGISSSSSTPSSTSSRDMALLCSSCAKTFPCAELLARHQCQGCCEPNVSNADCNGDRSENCHSADSGGDCGGVTVDCGGVTADCGDVTADCGDVTADCGDVTADCGDVTADCGGVTADCGGVTADSSGVTADCGDVTVDCGGVTADCSGVTVDCGGVTADSSGVTADCGDVRNENDHNADCTIQTRGINDKGQKRSTRVKGQRCGFPCGQCGKVLCSRQTLVTHQRTHSGSKPYQCRQCQRWFRSSSNLQAHLRTHTGKAPYMCPQCGRRFRQATHLNRHLVSHSGDRPHRCGECGKAYVHASSLKEHQLSHTHSAGTWVCDQCGKPFLSNKRLKVHLKTHVTKHPTQPKSNPNTRRHVCCICGASYRQASSLSRHMKLHQLTTGSQRTCSECGKVFRDDYEMRRHRCVAYRNGIRRYDECERSVKVADADSGADRQQQATDGGGMEPCSVYKCQVCFVVCGDADSHRQHTKSHSDSGHSNRNGGNPESNGLGIHRLTEAPATPICDCESEHNHADDSSMPHSLPDERIDNLPGHTPRASPEKSSHLLVSGKSSHTPGKKSNVSVGKKSQISMEKSNICVGKKIPGKKTAGDSVSRNKPHHVCEQCGASYSRASSLARHKRLHKGRQQQHQEAGQQSSKGHYQCPQCQRVFGDGSHLRRHLLAHSGTKPFVCTSCDKAYADAHTLREHMQVHTGLKSFICEACGKGFFTAKRLKEHARAHSDQRPYRCSQCSASYKHLSGLTSHRRTHSGSRPFSCGDCGKVFKDYTCHRRHLLSHSEHKPHACGRCSKAYKDGKSLRKHLTQVHQQAGN